MIRIILTLILLPLTAIAEPVTIRSGQHETFSRLVLSIGVGNEWQVIEADGGYVLELTGKQDGFDTTTVFDRIPKNRIASVSQQGQSALRLDVVCECFADAFLWRPGELVLDIIDGEDPELAVLLPRPEARGTPLQPAESPLRLPGLLTLEAATTAGSPSVAIPMGLQSKPNTSDLDATEAALIEGLARAASQGFLNPAVQVVPVALADETDPDVQVIEPTIAVPPRPSTPGVGITTAFERDFAIIGDALAAIGQQCLPADLFQLDAWADDSAFHSQVAALAEGLAGEFGEEPREAQDALARLYLHFGFGAETRAVLSADSAMSQSRQVLSELAGIIDEYPGTYALIAAQAGCKTPAALWAFYIEPIPLEMDERNFILQQFFVLPQPLRGQIAPRLARKFIAVGDPDAAAKLLRASENNDADATHEVQATRALIAEEFNDPEQAIAVLSREASDNARTSPDSVIRLIELALEQDMSPQESDLVLAAAMAQEYRDTPMAARLTLVEARGRIQKGEYQVALDLMSGRGDEDALAVNDKVFAHMADAAPPAKFLELAFGEIPDGQTHETENSVARRLIEFGFPERAMTFLRSPAEREQAAERRYLRAEAAIGMGNYTAGLDELIGMTDPRTRDLRAAAYTGLGDHRAALEASSPGSLPTTDGTMQFRANAWERLTVQDDEILSSFASAILSPPATNLAETLADRRAILAQSQESRRAIEGLLLRFDGTTPQQ